MILVFSVRSDTNQAVQPQKIALALEIFYMENRHYFLEAAKINMLISLL